MPDFVQMLQLPHWLMLAGLSVVIAGLHWPCAWPKECRGN
jgi:hypothetical protein